MASAHTTMLIHIPGPPNRKVVRADCCTYDCNRPLLVLIPHLSQVWQTIFDQCGTWRLTYSHHNKFAIDSELDANYLVRTPSHIDRQSLRCLIAVIQKLENLLTPRIVYDSLAFCCNASCVPGV